MLVYQTAERMHGPRMIGKLCVTQLQPLDSGRGLITGVVALVKQMVMH